MPSFEEITRHRDPDPDPFEDPWVQGPPAPESVNLVPWNPDWQKRYDRLASAIRDELGTRVLGLDHVGSTAVGDLAAKDIIDIDLTVADPRDEGGYAPALGRLGYIMTVREPLFHEHRCFRHTNPRANLHVFGPDCPEVIRHRMFRDWLRRRSDDRELYESAKRAAVPGSEGVMEYNARKQRVIREIYDRLFESAGMLH